MEEFYVVLEIQNSGTPAVLTTVYTDENQAYAKWHTILAVAAVSSLPYHAAAIIRGSDGESIEHKVYRHQAQVSAE